MYKGDYEEQFQKLVDQLSASLNYGIESLYDLSNKNVSLRDNLRCTVKDIAVSVDASGAPVGVTTFSLDIQGQIIGTQVIYAVNTANSGIYPTGGIFISYTQTQNGVLINNITGLPANQPFSLRIVAYG